MDFKFKSRCDAGDYDELIVKYLGNGYSNKEIQEILEKKHNLIRSHETIKKRVIKLGLKRKNREVPVEDLMKHIEEITYGSGSCLGYRSVWKKLQIENQIYVSREKVRTIMSIFNPLGVDLRSRKVLKRRIYYNKGPNFTVHLDGYDKLKPYGICIHACIDGYSRKILWLEAARSNKNASLIAGYFTRYLREINGVPRVVRADLGTENYNIGYIQTYLRNKFRDGFSGQSSFMYGKSTANTRIEAWWAYLRKSWSNFWMNFFKDLMDSGLFDNSNEMHIELIRYCFMGLIQKELDNKKNLWNMHTIRKNDKAVCPAGIPNILFEDKEKCFKFPILSDELYVLEAEFCETKDKHWILADFKSMCDDILDVYAIDKNIKTIDEALNVFCILVKLID